MNPNPQIAILETNRLIRSPEEAIAFEQALSQLAQTPEPLDLPALHLILDDACQQPEVMFSLIHYLESFDLQTQLTAFFQVLPQLSDRAPEWLTLLHTRILNDTEANLAFESLVQSLPPSQQQEVNHLLALASGKHPQQPQPNVA
jgi:Immunity protein 30